MRETVGREANEAGSVLCGYRQVDERPLAEGSPWDPRLAGTACRPSLHSRVDQSAAVSGAPGALWGRWPSPSGLGSGPLGATRRRLMRVAAFARAAQAAWPDGCHDCVGPVGTACIAR